MVPPPWVTHLWNGLMPCKGSWYPDDELQDPPASGWPFFRLEAGRQQSSQRLITSHEHMGAADSGVQEQDLTHAEARCVSDGLRLLLHCEELLGK